MPLYNQGEADGESRTIVVKKLKEPDRYRVLLHNDDYTSMDFVINILCGVFHKPLEEATAIMLAVHQQGVGQCGIYTREVAEAKVSRTERASPSDAPWKKFIDRPCRQRGNGAADRTAVVWHGMWPGRRNSSPQSTSAVAGGRKYAE